MIPGQSCWRKVYVATSKEAELESPPPRGTELTTTALKPRRGEAAGERRVLVRMGCRSMDVGNPGLSILLSSSGLPTLHSAALWVCWLNLPDSGLQRPAG